MIEQAPEAPNVQQEQMAPIVDPETAAQLGRVAGKLLERATAVRELENNVEPGQFNESTNITVPGEYTPNDVNADGSGGSKGEGSHSVETSPYKSDAAKPDDTNDIKLESRNPTGTDRRTVTVNGDVVKGTIRTDRGGDNRLELMTRQQARDYADRTIWAAKKELNRRKKEALARNVNEAA